MVPALLALAVAWSAPAQPDERELSLPRTDEGALRRHIASPPSPSAAAELRCGTRTPRPTDEAPRRIPADCSFSTTNPDPIYAPGPLYRIPVVVHVIQSSAGAGNLSDELVLSQITVMNEDLNALPGTPGAAGTDCRIELYLANTDPGGNATAGIRRITNDTYFREPYPGTGFKTALSWDTSRYLNIYSQDSNGFGGYATFPQQSAGAPDDGIVINYLRFGRPSIGGTPKNNRGRTGTHEVGHYLGLFHTFEGGCGVASPPGCYQFPGDLICDTNPEAIAPSDCPLGANSCMVGPDPVDNYMDYTNDICRNEFTYEQMLRMRCALTSYRATLVTGDLYVAGEGFGASSGNRVRVFRGNGTASPVNFQAYGAGQWGVGVTSGNLTKGPLGQIVTGPGPGGAYGPQVRAFQSTGSPVGKINFFAYATLRYGVNAVAAELDADGYDEIVTGTGPGAAFGPHVRGFDYDGVSVAALPKVSYFAYQTLQWGANVSSGDVEGDGYAEMLTGPGPGPTFGPQVRGFNHDNASVTSIAKINFHAFAATLHGVNVAGGDVEADRFDEIGAAPGPGMGPAYLPRMLGFDYDGTAVSALPGFDVTVSTGTSYGGRIGLGDVTGDGAAELLAGKGRDPSADAAVSPYAYLGASLLALPPFDAFPGGGFGVNVASGDLGN